ncbi:unnamed protein product [Nippostrongylus brasiliensis]|uniref:Uncharacterized protein n=1 Tax=Nippostrongylus brasiliensis TaxID=27835 RepID=A0A0N4XZU4_NIPBR|nr:hypothetical protein Q1695_015066 [Nippostrongylus brasiliensis]VDL72324.1 unnamed protein product [Nippostrongylus brasiliensis]
MLQWVLMKEEQSLQPHKPREKPREKTTDENGEDGNPVEEAVHHSCHPLQLRIMKLRRTTSSAESTLQQPASESSGPTAERPPQSRYRIIKQQ